MQTTDDMIQLFQTMREMYGNLWRYGPDAAKTWRNALSSCTDNEIRKAVERCQSDHPRPPTLPEFVALTRRDRPRANTYSEYEKLPIQMRRANQILLRVLKLCGGVDSATLKTMVDFKNACVEEYDEMTLENMQTLNDELMTAAKSAKQEDIAADLLIAQEQFRRRVGLTKGE